MRRLFKNKLFLLICTIVIIFIIMGLTTGGGKYFSTFGNNNIISIVLSPFQKGMYFLGRKIHGGISFFAEMSNLKSQNEELMLKASILETENIRIRGLEEENKRLRELLGFSQRFVEYDKVGANIIAKDPGNWFDVFVIDKGTKDGVKNKAVVITNVGLVGYVADAGINSSKVISIIDEDCTVSGRLTKTRDLVVIKGSFELKSKGLSRMEIIPIDTEIEAGDMVETSGLGGIFPKGIAVGKVNEVRQGRGGHNLERYAIIQPSVDFKRLEEVFVLIR